MLTLRIAAADDAMDVARVHVRSWQRGYRGLLPDKYLDGLRGEDRASHYTFVRSLADGPVTIIASEGREVKGFAAVGAAGDEVDRGVGELLALYVDPDHWSRGIGQALITDARDRLVQFGFRQAQLWVLAGNDRADRFYQADGWAPDGSRRQDEVWGITVDEVCYRRALDSDKSGR